LLPIISCVLENHQWESPVVFTQLLRRCVRACLCACMRALRWRWRFYARVQCASVKVCEGVRCACVHTTVRGGTEGRSEGEGVSALVSQRMHACVCPCVRAWCA
jgi:hypothetical protein